MWNLYCQTERWDISKVTVIKQNGRGSKRLFNIQRKYRQKFQQAELKMFISLLLVVLSMAHIIFWRVRKFAKSDY
jgi:hypothetical protein